MSLMQQAKESNLHIQNMIDEMFLHHAWHGDLTGIEAEALLRLKPAYTYLLRQGEKWDHFYLSFVKESGTEFSHLPFTIDYPSLQWFYRNGYPHFGKDLESFIPEIMHQEEKACLPLRKFAKPSS